MTDSTEILQRLKSIKRMLKCEQRKPLTIEDGAVYIGQSKSFLYKLTSAGKLAFYKPNGKKIYFLKSDLDKYIFSNRKKSNKEIEQEAIEINFKMSNKKKQ